MNSNTAGGSIESNHSLIQAVSNLMADCVRADAERLQVPVDVMMQKHCMVIGRWLADGSRQCDRFIVHMREADYDDFNAQVGDMRLFGGELRVTRTRAYLNDDGTQHSPPMVHHGWKVLRVIGKRTRVGTRGCRRAPQDLYHHH